MVWVRERCVPKLFLFVSVRCSSSLDLKWLLESSSAGDTSQSRGGSKPTSPG